MARHKKESRSPAGDEPLTLMLAPTPRLVPRSVRARLFASRLSTHVSLMTIGGGLWLVVFGWQSLNFSMLSLQGDNLGRIQAQVTQVVSQAKVNAWYYRFSVDGTRFYTGLDYLNKSIPAASTAPVDYSRSNPEIHRMAQSVNKSHFSIWAENIAIIVFSLLWLIVAVLCGWAIRANYQDALKWLHLLQVGQQGQATLRKKPKFTRNQAYFDCEFAAQELPEPDFKVHFDVKDYNALLVNKTYPMLYDADKPTQRCVWLELPQPMPLNEQGRFISHWRDYQSTFLLWVESAVILVVLTLIIG